MKEKREERKHEHLAHAVRLEAGPESPGWEDIRLVHQALLRNDFAKIDTSKKIFNKRFALPLVVNAITGGAPGLEEINTSLATVAKETGIGLAVGSQMAGIRNKAVRYTYEAVRKANPQGFIMANMSALASPQSAKEAVEMIEADALQLHINGIQELLMTEGDRDFRQMAENIREIVNISNVPVMVKEVGFGLSRETAAELYELGVSALDISGMGGTNFAAIELARSKRKNMDSFLGWGIPAAASLIEVRSLNLPVFIMASGGITSGLDLLKGLALGADVAGIAGKFLKVLIADGESELLQRVFQIKEELQIFMMATGAAKIGDVSSIPLVISGETKNWCEQRGIDTKYYTERPCLKNSK